MFTVENSSQKNWIPMYINNLFKSNRRKTSKNSANLVTLPVVRGDSRRKTDRVPLD
jgi:hypothetical protein